MSELTLTERESFELLLGMKSGYVLDFSDRTFYEFIDETTGLDINDPKYAFKGSSKANRLRAFLKIESNYHVSTLLQSLVDHWLASVQSSQIELVANEVAYYTCLKVIERLKQSTSVSQLDAFTVNNEFKDFNLLAKSILESIEKNQPEAALDRLHTYVVKYIRQLCTKHSIAYIKDDPLHNLFGKYVKFLISENRLESVMTERILKFTTSILDAFNDIRNNKSLAHDNPLLNYQESVLIFNSVANTIKFIEAVEACNQTSQDSDPLEEIDLPF